MTTTVIFKNRKIEMEGTLEILLAHGDEMIEINSRAVSGEIYTNFHQFRKNIYSDITSYGRFRITIERLGDK